MKTGRIALIDYGIGNLRSVFKALQAAGADVFLTSSAEQVLSADKVVLPGVGAFGDGMAGLRARHLVDALNEVVEKEMPFLGICVGMQLLFESSNEQGEHAGLGFLPGVVTRFKLSNTDLKVPQTGWNQIHPERDSSLLKGLPAGSYAYFNHGYYCVPAKPADWIASSEYGLRYACAVGRGRLYAVQFHPEKSQAVGLQILRNFVERC